MSEHIWHLVDMKMDKRHVRQAVCFVSVREKKWHTYLVFVLYAPLILEFKQNGHCLTFHG